MQIRAEKRSVDPEELRRFLAQQLQAEKPLQPEPEGAGEDPASHFTGHQFNFKVKPEELEAYLDQYVIGQSAAKGILATKICTHFNRLNLPLDEDEELVGKIKNNVLMIGPTGVGKTYLIRIIARKLGVPFVKGDATKFSETGYVGGDVEDLIRELVRETGGDIERAQCGIVYIDEIDKIASSRNLTGPDVSRSGVQRNLLKLMEETEVELKPPHDIASQMETVLQMQRTGKLERKRINTRNILFIVSGAFSDLEEIIATRLNQAPIGFQLNQGEGAAQTSIARENLLSQVRAEDLIEYGFESEFVGRLPVVAVLQNLSGEDLLEILRNPKSGVVLAKKLDFRAYGIEIDFTDEALTLLAEQASREHTGARGLVSVLEKALLTFEKKLPSSDVTHFTVTPDTIHAPEADLQKMLEEAALQKYQEQFFHNHSIRLEFSAEAAAVLKAMSRTQHTPLAQLCAQLFTDFGHGLRLTEKQHFEITAEIVHNPQESLNLLIKKFYSHRDVQKPSQDLEK